jgi:hypothetical protein
MTTTVLDSNNLEAIVQDATGEGLGETKDGKVETEKADTKVAAEKEQKTEAALDVEGEDGLTAREKAELSAKMLKAVGKRVREKREAEEFAAEQYNLRLAAEHRAKELEDQIKTAPKPEPAEEPKSPARADFATDEEYVKALVDHGVAEALKEKEAADEKAAEETRIANVLETARTRIAKAIELVPDYEDVTSTIDERIPPAVASYMQESEMFAELGYFLAKNPEVIKALQKIGGKFDPKTGYYERVDKQLVEIGKIEGKLTPFAPVAKDNAPAASTKVNGKQPQAAPRETGETLSMARRAAPVITPISNTGTSGEVNLETATVREHIAEFAKNRGVNLTRRQRH